MKNLNQLSPNVRTFTNVIRRFITLTSVTLFTMPMLMAQDDCNSTFPCYSSLSPADYEDLPIQYIKVVFHFIAQDYGNGLVNFQCSAPENLYYAPSYVQAIMNTANGVLSNPAQSNQTTAQDLPDLRLRYIPANGAEDICTSIYFHNSAPTTFSPDVLNIVFRDAASTGSADAINVISSHQVHYKAFVLGLLPNDNEYGWNARVISHELGHALGLCHAHSTTTCPEIDVVEECGNNTSATSCAGDNTVCIWNNSNNVMANGVQDAFVHSQWAFFYHKLLETDYTYLANDEMLCEVPQTEPLEIEENSIEQWDCAKYVDRDVEIRTGATLIITAPIVMASTKRIIVHRGGRLFLNGGEISGISKDCFWGGIVVHGNASVEQPKKNNAQNENYTLSSDDAGVVWLKDCKIYWASPGVTTRGTGSLSTHSYFGGLVMADNAHFIDCGRAMEFMKYSYPNESYFNGGIIRSTGNVNVSNEGISIWACQNIEITSVHFEGLNDYGIYGISYDAQINDCVFNGKTSTMGMAIGSDNTMPNASPNPIEIRRCTSYVYRAGVDAFSSPNLNRGFIIEDSRFYGSSSFAYGINIIGESTFDLFNNKFTGHGANIRIIDSGEVPGSVIRCNTSMSNQFYGVIAGGQNKFLQIRGNIFEDSGQNQITATGTLRDQGDVFNGAGNKFATPQSAILASPQQTSQFSYFVHNLDLPAMEVNEKPLNNLSDNGTNNYYNRSSSAKNNLCGDSPDPITYTEQDLISARIVTAAKRTAYTNAPTNLTKKSEYYIAIDKQNSILSYLVQVALDQGAFEDAEDYLLGEGTPAYTRAVVGLKTFRGDLTGADSILYTIPVLSQDDQWFRDIMEINFKIEAADTLYRLTNNEENLLDSIGRSENSVMKGYACAILSLCTGNRCELEFESSQNFAIHPQNTEHFANSEDLVSFVVYPNPTSDDIVVRSSKPYRGITEFRVMDFLGRMIVHKTLPSDQEINEIIQLPISGIYFLSITSENIPMFTQKLIRK